MGDPKDKTPDGKTKTVQKGKFTLKKGGAKTTNALIEELKRKKASERDASHEGATAGGVPGEPEKPKIPIEEEILAVFAKQAEAKVPMFRRFWIELAPKLTLPTTSLSILDAFASGDVNAERVAKPLERNTYYANQFRMHIETLGKREETPSLESAVVLLGMTNSRNLILALQMHRVLAGGHPEWKVVPPQKVATLQLKPNELLKYALRAEEPYLKDKSPYADIAFVGGMLFDWLGYYAKLNNRADLSSYIDVVFNHSLKAAKIGIALAEAVPELKGSKNVFSACMVHDIGKIVLALLDPKYTKFNDACVRKGMPREVRLYAERSRYTVDHGTIGAQVCRLFKVYESIAPVVRHHHRPFLLKAQPGGLYGMAQIVALATKMATVNKKPEKPGDPIIQEWRGNEILDLKIPFEIYQAASAAGAG